MKSQLLALAAVRFDTVDLEGLKVRVREIGTTEFAHYGELAGDKKNEKGEVVTKGDKLKATAYLIEACVVDDDGAAVLSAEEALQLSKSARVSMPIVNKVMELSGFGEDEEKHADAS